MAYGQKNKFPGVGVVSLAGAAWWEKPTIFALH